MASLLCHLHGPLSPSFMSIRLQTHTFQYFWAIRRLTLTFQFKCKTLDLLISVSYIDKQGRHAFLQEYWTLMRDLSLSWKKRFWRSVRQRFVATSATTRNCKQNKIRHAVDWFRCYVWTVQMKTQFNDCAGDRAIRAPSNCLTTVTWQTSDVRADWGYKKQVRLNK